jgi:hypothetical protein
MEYSVEFILHNYLSLYYVQQLAAMVPIPLQLYICIALYSCLFMSNSVSKFSYVM